MKYKDMTDQTKNTVKEDEILHFQNDSNSWWDEKGAFAPLHKLNPTRMRFIIDEVKEHFSVESTCTSQTLKGLKILDVGCGGGLVCEPLSRLGGDIMGIDADEQAIEVAKSHAQSQGLDINYRNTTSDELSKESDKFDVVCALEIIEHVNDPEYFLKTCIECLKPDGLLIISTLNRTPKSFLLGIVAAEHILRWVPKNTHNWSQFIKPSEISRFVVNEGLSLTSIKGIVYSPIKCEFNLSDKDIENNYILSASKQ